MDQKERGAIKKHLIALCKDTNLDNLMIFVETKNLLDKPEIDKIKNARHAHGGSELAANSLFYSIIQTRQDGFANLIQGLREFHQGHLADLLENDVKLLPRVNDEDSTALILLNGQNYKTIKQELIASGRKFEDSHFPPELSSILFPFNSKLAGYINIEKIEWKRPTELVSEPRFVIDGVSRTDLKQGRLGDCWFLASMANLAMSKSLVDRVIPEDNSFQHDYCGIFHFRFWYDGQWVEVVVDDKLPTVDNKLIFCHSNDESLSEYWFALMEKAYAKLHGSYEAIHGGWISEAFQAFTGGLGVDYLDLKNDSEITFSAMENAFKRGDMVGCGTSNFPFTWTDWSDGIVIGHAYSVTKVKRLETSSGKVNLVRLRNPHGEWEWTGPWSGESSEWEQVSEAAKAEMEHETNDDGEFWMCYEDFSDKFVSVSICYLNVKDYMWDVGCGARGWESSEFNGKWVKGSTAGDPHTNPSNASNPQYEFELNMPDCNDEDGKCAVLVSLNQKNFRRKLKDKSQLYIGFSIYKLEDENDKPVQIEWFQEHALVAKTVFKNRWSNCISENLVPGKYVVVPTTEKPGEEGEFLLRVFKQVPTKITF